MNFTTEYAAKVWTKVNRRQSDVVLTHYRKSYEDN
jgi:hypothetical protein